MSDTRVRPREAGLPAISGHQYSLDGVRAVAALSVLVYHVASTAGDLYRAGTLGWLYNGGQVGVPIFFALSGLLLYRPWAAAVLDPQRRKPGVRTYFRKRALRILPGYWAVVVCFMLAVGLGHIADPGTWIPLLTLTHTYIPHPWWGSNLGPPQLGQMWSLAVEAAWYVTLPATAAVLAWHAKKATTVDGRARRLLTAIAIYASISFVYTAVIFLPEPKPLMGLWLPRFPAWFASGMAMAVVTVWVRLEPDGPVARWCRTIASSWGACWTGALMLYVIASTPATGALDLVSLDVIWTSYLDLILYALCAAAFVAPVALAPPGHPALGRILGNAPMRFLGKISYSVFLWQMLIIVGWYEWNDRVFRGHVATDLPLMLVATIAAATASYYLVEVPAQRLAHRRPRRAGPDPRPKAAPSSVRSTLPDLPHHPAPDATAPPPAGS